MNNKKIIWSDIQNRGFEEIQKSFDTGLCNRLFYWETLQIISSHNDFKYKVEVEEKYWPELRELIHLPNTDVINKSEKNICNPLNNDFIENNEKYILSHDCYHSEYDYSMMCNFDKYLDKERPITKIKLKNNHLNKLIVNLCKDLIGIHIRRGRGIIYGESEINTLPSNIRRSYKKFREREGEFISKYYMYEFIKDDVYFKIIDEILNKYPNQKFYISYDIPDIMMNYYQERYPNRIFNKNYFNNFITRSAFTSEVHLRNIIDLFCLSNTKFIIKHPLSTWSTFAHNYTPKIGVSVTDSMDNIVENVSKLLESNN
jgi:hypothetical protein